MAKEVQPAEAVLASLLNLKVELERKVPVGTPASNPYCEVLMKINQCLFSKYPR